MKPLDDDYDPHVHRIEHLAHPTNNLETLFHLIKGCLGTGVLAMPEGFKFAGMINGIVGFAVIACFATYCIHVLYSPFFFIEMLLSLSLIIIIVRGQYILCKKKKVGLLIYSESMEVACDVGPECFRRYRRVFPALTDFFLIFYQTGACCIYWVFFGSNLKYVLDTYVEHYPLYMYMLILFIPHFLMMCVRNLKLLAPFSMAADLITLVTFSVVFYYIFISLDARFSDRPAIGKVTDFPLFLGTVLFSLQSIPMCIAVENNMATPDYFRKPFGALNVGYSLLSVVYICVGIFGYWRYGEDIESTITLNFPPHEILAQVIILSYCAAIFISYGVNGHVPIDILLNSYILPRMGEDISEKKKLFVEMMLRLSFVIITCLFATTIPLLGLIISLCGCFCLSALGIIFPGMIEICAYWEEGISTPKTFTFWKCIFIITVGVIGLLSGLYSTIRSMYERLSSGDY